MCNISNTKLSHSESAISVIHEFYDKKFMLYVEGDDDIPFWDEQFRKYVPTDFYKIEPVHGKENLAEYIMGIDNGTLTNVVVACDADYSNFLKNGIPKHRCIVRTYGHSIENTMFCPLSVAVYIRRITNTSNDYLGDINVWIEKFCNSAKALLPYEVKNAVDSDHAETLPKIFNNGYHYFKVSESNQDLDDDKISRFITSIDSIYNPDDISSIEKEIEADQRELRFLIQGHFFAEAIMNYIRNKVKKIKGKTISISNDSIYESFTDCKHSCNPICKDKLFLRDQIKSVYDYFVLIG